MSQCTCDFVNNRHERFCATITRVYPQHDQLGAGSGDVLRSDPDPLVHLAVAESGGPERTKEEVDEALDLLGETADGFGPAADEAWTIVANELERLRGLFPT